MNIDKTYEIKKRYEPWKTQSMEQSSTSSYIAGDGL